MPELTIIVPVYNVEKYLPKCIDSILAQTFTDFELILIDDGSPDRCGEICDEYAAKDSRIVVIHQKNQGVSAARNAGLDAAQGEYIGFADSDDWIDQRMFETMLTVAQSSSADVVSCSIEYRTSEGEPLQKDFCKTGTFTRKELLLDLYGMPSTMGGGCWNKIIKAEKIKSIRFRTDVSIGEDFLYLFRCYANCNYGVKISDAFYYVCIRSGSATRASSVKAVFLSMVGAYELYRLADNCEKVIRSAGATRFLDVCERYLPEMKQLGKETNQPYKKFVCRIKWMMAKSIIRALTKHLLSMPTIRHYTRVLIS